MIAFDWTCRTVKSLVPLFAIVLGWAATASALSHAPLTSLRAIHELTRTEASNELPVAFPATVTFYDHHNFESNLFVQDKGIGIYVGVQGDLKLLPGDRILVQGTTAVDFRVDVRSTEIRVLSHGALPAPIPASFDELIRTKYDCTWVLVRGIARTIDRTADDSYDFTRIQLLTDGGYIELTVSGGNDSLVHSLLDADVEVTGVTTASTDGKNQVRGIQIYVPSLANVKIVKHTDANPWSLPVTSMDAIIDSHRVHDLTDRIRVHGTVTYYDPGEAVALQDGLKSVWVLTRTKTPMKIGDVADAIGFPDVNDGFLAVTRAELQDTGVQAPVSPAPSNWSTLTSSTRLFDLVSIEGQVVAEVQEGPRDEYVVQVEGNLFTAIIHNPWAPAVAPTMKQVPLGSKVRVTGICILNNSNRFEGPVLFDILLRSFDDVTVIGKPSLLTVQNLIILLGALLLAFLAVGTRGWLIERRVSRQTTRLAYFERRRSRILEDINSSRPLPEIIDQITELVSLKLKGAPCWCQIAGGAKLGNWPENLATMRVVPQQIPSRTGPPLGRVFAAFDTLTKPRAIESESLSMATALAALAIETSRLYSDLIRRSEFDRLTNTRNRFSFEKLIDAQIEDAKRQGTIFGLIYIDLDDFKNVNDQFGHGVGDNYLQEMTFRMKRQLRSRDTLARLGGDEFVILLPLVRNRGDVEEIALRLERCFDEQFPVEDFTLYPAASVGIAIYPEDGATRDSLLHASDAAMYVEKQTKSSAVAQGTRQTSISNLRQPVAGN
jgi:diguanylate cyclase (GGDEF)-like protein